MNSDMKYYITLFLRHTTESKKEYYSVATLATDIEFDKKAYNEVVEMYKDAVGQAVGEKIVECESVLKDEYDKREGQEKTVEVNILGDKS